MKDFSVADAKRSHVDGQRAMMANAQSPERPSERPTMITAPETARRSDQSGDTPPTQPIRASLYRYAAILQRASETAAVHLARRACANRPDRLRPGSRPCGRSP